MFFTTNTAQQTAALPEQSITQVTNALEFCGIQFRCLERRQLAADPADICFIVTVNAEYIVKAQRDPVFLAIINSHHASFDGQIPYVFARLLYPQRHIEKISGSDLIYDVCALAQQRQRSLFLLGGHRHANALAVQKIQQGYGIRVAGFAPAYQTYPFSEEHNQAIRAQLQQFRPDYLFVAFGAVKQERWIADNLAFLQTLGVRLVVGCGGTFDFVAGTIKRAPRWVQRSGLEGLWRLIHEPSLFRLRRLLLSLRFFAVFYHHHLATIFRSSQPR